MTGPVLTIIDGLQAGSQMPLERGESRVGSAAICAVVVADPVLQDNHFDIVVADTTLIRVIEPLRLADGTVLASGSELAIGGPTCFSAGTTRFHLDTPIPQAQRSLAAASIKNVARHRRRRVVLPVTGAAALATCIGLFLGIGTHPPRADATPIAAPRLAASRPNADIAAAALRQRLDRSALNTLSVAEQSDGTVTTGGVLLPGEQAAWNAVRQWYDGSFGNDAVLIEQFSSPDAMPPLRIAAVWHGNNPYVIDDHGSRLRPGASLGDGWSIDHIDAGRIFVRRGAQAVALRY